MNQKPAGTSIPDPVINAEYQRALLGFRENSGHWTYWTANPTNDRVDQVDREKSQKYSPWYFGIAILASFFFYTLAITFHFNNVCVNYLLAATGELFPVSTWLYIGIVILTIISLGFYSLSVKFCTPGQRFNHILLSVALTSSMASVLSWFDVYAYTLNAFAAATVFFMWFLTFVLYIAVFLESHLRTCPDYRIHLMSSKGCGIEQGITASVIIFGIAWLTYIILLFFFSEELYTAPNRPDNSTCASNT